MAIVFGKARYVPMEDEVSTSTSLNFLQRIPEGHCLRFTDDGCITMPIEDARLLDTACSSLIQ